jgi:tetratricopeptide (TPR) repeat protein
MTNAHLERAQIWLEQNRFDLAEPELRKVLAVDPEEPWAHAALAVCLVELGRAKDGLAAAERAIGLAPEWDVPHVAHAHALLALERPREAEAAARQAIACAADDSRAHAMLARALVGQKRWREAQAAAEAGLQIDPEDDTCANMRALALIQLGEGKAADLALEAALRRDPENPQTHMNLGWSALHRRDAGAAIAHYREALRLDPGSADARAGLVEALKARNWLYRVVLRYFLLLTRIKTRTAFVLMIGTVLVRRVIVSLAESNPTFAPALWTVFWALVAFVLTTWIAQPLFNTILRFDPDGRHALARDQVVQSNWLLGTLAVSVTCAVLWLLGVPGMKMGAVLIAVMVLPVTATAGAAGKSRYFLGTATILLTLVALSASVSHARFESWVREVRTRRGSTVEMANERLRSLSETERQERLETFATTLERKDAVSLWVQVFGLGFVAFTWIASAVSVKSS